LENNKKIEEILEQLKLMTPEQIEMAKIESIRSGKTLEDTIMDMNVVKEEDFTKVLAISRSLPYVDTENVKVDPGVMKYLTKDLATRYSAVPFAQSGGSINVAMLDPDNVQVIEFIEKKSGYPVKPFMVSRAGLSSLLDRYQDVSGEVSEALKSVTIDQDTIAAVEEKANANTGGDVENLVQDAPVTRAVNTILEYAAKARASDVHIEPREKTVKVRYRIDGILHDTMNLPAHIHPALVSRIKILSGMKIDEHRIPQDGGFSLHTGDHDIDLRVSMSPTVFGEKVVIRLLDKSGGLITLEGLGVRGRAFEIIEAGTKRPHGMILSTGPTGSGKSTTLYALLNKMNRPEVNIITLEDPVEYHVDGVNQIQINAAVGLTFSSGLRSILRQDPDIIMVGEIRDAETAGLAVQSALTGHTVLSTIHTNSAAGVLPRLLDMEIEPFLIASTVSTVIGQRLVRRICPKCKVSYVASPTLTAAIKKEVGDLMPSKTKDTPGNQSNFGYDNIPFAEDETFTLYKGGGCNACRGTGFMGRIGIYEVFPVTPTMEKLLLSHATSAEIQDAAVKEGMIIMRQDGFLKALEGVTTVEEVISKATEY
jgi:type IV pilus assembly protein PilB